MICRYRLNANGKVLTFGNECLKNWKEISYAVKRSDYGGTVRSFSGSFQFTDEAYHFVMDAYLSEYVSARTTISVYTVNEDQSFSLLYKARLDYGTMSVADKTVTINSFDDTIASLIKAKKGTKYEYKVDDIAEDKYLTYDGMNIANKVNFVCGGTTTEIAGTTIIENINVMRGGSVMPMYSSDADYMVKRSITYGDVMRYDDGAWDTENVPKYTYFIKCESSITIHLLLQFSMQAGIALIAGGHYVKIIKRSSKGVDTVIYSQHNTFDPTTILGRGLGFYFDGDIAMNTGDELFVVMALSATEYTEFEIPVTMSFFTCSVTWVDRILPVNMRLVKPSVVLSKLLESMNETDSEMTGVIESEGDDRFNQTMILPSESARRMSSAKMSTSFGDFAKWMESVFGYVYRIDGTQVTFVRRDTLYDSATAIEAESVNNVEMSVDDSRIYSSVKVGYSKKDYDTNNGKDEFRWEEEYDTGVTIKDSTLEFMSPYRADAYGIEFLAESSTTAKAEELFFVGVVAGSSAYTLDRSVVVEGVEFPSTMFNAMYSPRTFIEANKSLIASCCDSLKFASSTGNSEVIIDGTAENALFALGERLFSAAMLKFDSFVAMEHEDSSLIQVKKDGVTYTGYMNERSCKYGQYDGVSYELLIKSIEK